MARPSLKQLEVRRIFKGCVECFNKQPLSGGVEPPNYGPRNRSWWYDEATFFQGHNYYRGRTVSWLGGPMKIPTMKSIHNKDLPIHTFPRRDELGFIKFFALIRGFIADKGDFFLYEGSDPWYDGRDPDEVAVIVWKIAAWWCTAAYGANPDVLYTPATISSQRKASALSIAVFTYSWLFLALHYTGKTDIWIRNHLAIIYAKGREDKNGFCWWLDDMEHTHLIRPWVELEDVPDDIHNAPDFGTIGGKDIFCRFSEGNAFYPYHRPPPPGNKARYYNFFMQQTLRAYHNNVTPAWCTTPVLEDAYVQSLHKDMNFGGSGSLVIRNQNGPGILHRTYLKAKKEDFLYAVGINVNGISNSTGQPWEWVGCYGVDPDSWTENIITWNNQPEIGELLDEKLVDTYGWHWFQTHKYTSVCLKFVSESIPPVGLYDIVATSSEGGPVAGRPQFGI